MTADGRFAVSGGNDLVVRRWDLRRRREMAAVGRHRERVVGVAISQDGRCIVSASDDGRIRLWRMHARPRVQWFDTPDRITALAMSPDGRWAVTASWDGTLRQWDLATGTAHGGPLKAGGRGGTQALAYFPDNRRLVSGSAYTHQLKLWEMPMGSCIQAKRGFDFGFLSLAVSPDGRLVAGGCLDGLIRVWDTHSGRSWAPLAGHSEVVNCVRWLPDGERLLSAASDGRIKAWDLSRARQPVAAGTTRKKSARSR